MDFEESHNFFSSQLLTVQAYRPALKCNETVVSLADIEPF